MYLNKQIRIFLLSIIFLAVLVIPVKAALVDELKDRISDKTAEIKKIETEIAEYQKEIDELEGQSDTLKNSIRKLDTIRKKLKADIRFTQIKINSATLKIEKLALEITEKSAAIDESNKETADIIRKIDEAETNSLVEILLSNNTFSSFMDDIEGLRQLQEVVRKNVKELEALKAELKIIKLEGEKQKRSLVNSRSELSDRKQITENNKREKSRLLSITKNKESNYKKLLKEKKKLREEYEMELSEIESQLRIAIDPNSIPHAGKGIFMPPLPDVEYKSCYGRKTNAKNCITQYFGNTPFAKSGAYNGKTHNGIDFRARTSQKVRAVLNGTIVEVGDTDIIPKCLSYGKWVLIRHNNGLSTLYAHLNLIKVAAGQEINTGDIIGYSGYSGYVSPPGPSGAHLHLTTYATAGVKVVRLGDIPGRPKTNCSDARIPIAPFNAYLNPLDYL
jgi:murein DD-endopeptidase MepM/ murein hydrolase activator NlpD